MWLLVRSSGKFPNVFFLFLEFSILCTKTTKKETLENDKITGRVMFHYLLSQRCESFRNHLQLGTLDREASKRSEYPIHCQKPITCFAYGFRLT